MLKLVQRLMKVLPVVRRTSGTTMRTDYKCNNNINVDVYKRQDVCWTNPPKDILVTSLTGIVKVMEAVVNW